MDKENIKKIFKLALQYHQQNNLVEAEKLYNDILKIDPRDTAVLVNLGVLLYSSKNYEKAKDLFEKVIVINPDLAEAHHNLGRLFGDNKKYQKAISCYENAIKIKPNYIDAYFNLGLVFKEIGIFQKSIDCFEKIIEIDPEYEDAYNNCAALLGDTRDTKQAKIYLEKAIKINPQNVGLYWNLHGQSSDLDEALSILKKANKINNNHSKTKIMIGALEGYKGNFNYFNDLLKSDDFNHPYTRSVKWLFSLSKLPKIFFNRLDFFDAIISLSERARPFYEFGVWRGDSFKYFINTFKKGFGFDTFTGLPEKWHDTEKEKYPSFGEVPKIEGGEFIVGKFEKTLSKFFLKNRPVASLINFDADLYSSTLCALKNSNKIIDEKTILIFDEFIMNKNWEKDEYKALNEFCNDLSITYEVLAVSLYTKQVAVKLKQ